MIESNFLNLVINKTKCKNFLCIGNNDVYKEIKCKNSHFMPCVIPIDDEDEISEKEIYDIVFIDGDHTYTGSCEDFTNACTRIKENGLIILHDTIPPDERAQNATILRGVWCGQVWKTVRDIRIRGGFEVFTIYENYGYTFVRVSKDIKPIDNFSGTSFKDFQANKGILLGIIDIEELDKRLGVEKINKVIVENG